MADVKWIKLSTQMFDDEKIKLIESLPESDTILIIWVKLLAQAGKTNASGYIYLNENIPFTDEMLATIFNRPLTTVRMALKTFEGFGMIQVTDDHFIAISNWEKHQNIDGLEKIREDSRKRVQKFREKQKRLGNVTGNVTVTDGNALEEEEEREEEEEKIYIPFSEIVSYLNDMVDAKYKASSKKTKDLIKARWNDGFTLEDFKTVIDKKADEWLLDPNMAKYLRPETLFGTKFESYLNQQVVKKSGKGDKREEARKLAEESELPF